MLQCVKWYATRDNIPLRTAQRRAERMKLGEFNTGRRFLTEREWQIVKKTIPKMNTHTLSVKETNKIWEEKGDA